MDNTQFLLQIGAVIGGLLLLVWSATRFVDGSAALSRHLGLPPLLIGMLVIGFGTSAPELTVSVMSAMQGNGALALGNAYGSNIVNIALILGATAMIRPIIVQSRVLRYELPILLAASILAWWLIADGHFDLRDGIIQLVLFLVLVLWSVWQGLRQRNDALAEETISAIPSLSLRAGLLWVIVGLLLLVLASRVLVWGAVGLAQSFGISDLVIGLTVVAAGTSLPEFASAWAAARRGESDLVLGNILGSNLFNALFVAALSGVISPHAVAPALLTRDLPLMTALTAVLMLMGLGLRGQGRINRFEGAVLLLVFVVYTSWLIYSS